MAIISADLIQRAADSIRQADSLIIAAGAGMGVDSGLPDFRGNQGFWQAYPALGKAKMDFASIASPTAFQNDIRLAWGFYGHRLALYRNTIPHEGFAILKQWGDAMPNGYHIFTSNVDGQFQKAGFDHDCIYECHGSIHHLQCMEPCGQHIWPATEFHPQVDAENCLLVNSPPACPHCGDTARPNVLMFGDWHWNSGRSEMQEERLSRWFSSVNKPVIIELGAGTHIPSVRYFAENTANRYSASLIRINPREASVDNSRHVGLACGAPEGLSEITSELQKYQ